MQEIDPVKALTKWARPIKWYYRWLARHYPDQVARWSSRLAAQPAQAEGAVAEALIWEFLDDRCDEICLADTGTGGPDFLCKQNDHRYYVEVTNISRDVCCELTSLPDVSVSGGGAFSLLTKQAKCEISNKAGQFSDGPTDAPIVVFVTTLHETASRLCVTQHAAQEMILGTTGFGFTLDVHTGSQRGDSFNHAANDYSIATKSESLELSRCNISAVVLAGLGVPPPSCELYGVLHAGAIRWFDPQLLRDVDFCSMSWPPSQDPDRPGVWVQAKWTNLGDARRAAEARRRRANGIRVADLLGWHNVARNLEHLPRAGGRGQADRGPSAEGRT